MGFADSIRAPLWLASRSARRHRLLEEAGFPATVRPASIDDGVFTPPPVRPAHWVMALAYLKARWVADRLREEGAQRGTVLGADTVCVHEGRILGQPTDRDHARAMLGRLRGATHETLTGICLILLPEATRLIWFDRATVRCGPIDDAELERYLAGDQWRGKAGAYNLGDRQRDGWPLECDGDPATVMGLPLRRLVPLLAGLRASE